MSVANLMEDVMVTSQYLPEAEVSITTYPLTDAEREEVLAFLSERPAHTICIAGLIRDNGAESAHKVLNPKLPPRAF